MMFRKCKSKLNIGYVDEDYPFKRVGIEGQGIIFVPWVIETILPPIIIGVDPAQIENTIFTKYANVTVDGRYYQTLTCDNNGIATVN